MAPCSVMYARMKRRKRTYRSEENHMTSINIGRPITVYGKNTDNCIITDLGNE